MEYWTPASALVVAAHPDDIEFGCAGTVARWVSEGAHVTYALLTNGAAGSSDPNMTRQRLAELREAGIGLPIIASAGVRTFDDCREYFWAGADAVSLGSEIWLASYPGYLLGPVRGLQIRRLIRRVEAYERDPRGAWARPGSSSRAARRFSSAVGSAEQLLHR